MHESIGNLIDNHDSISYKKIFIIFDTLEVKINA